WAITVHKSQGMTLDVVEVDLSKSFAAGMGYVALSRVRSLQGLHLKGINRNALAVDPLVNDHDKLFQEQSVGIE
ncbi:C-terminal helicase domain-containing protein, partial [Patescibacteria group bacterium]